MTDTDLMAEFLVHFFIVVVPLTLWLYFAVKFAFQISRAGSVQGEEAESRRWKPATVSFSLSVAFLLATIVALNMALEWFLG